MNNAMRFPTSSCLLCKPTILARTWGIQRIPIASSRAASSLSAIHHGLRQSEKSRPQGFQKTSLEAAKSRRSPRSSPRGRDRDSQRPDPGFKIKKGKKDITDRGPKRPTRQSRFNDPKYSFGKKSLVYHMKNGVLREKMAELEKLSEPENLGRSRITPSARGARSTPMTSDDFMKSFGASGERSTKPPRDNRTGRGTARLPTARDSRTKSFADARSRGNERESTRPRSDANHFDRQRRTRTEGIDTFSFASRRESSKDAPGQERERPSRETQDTRKEPRSFRDDDAPIRIHHTTAASQFLYGRSVVEAALKASRRQLYKLYIYSGDDRRNISQDEALERLAQRKGVDVVKVPNNNLRMMDKMSGGRPHNGCVLEASPLPQLPLKALGSLSENAAEPGFHVDVTYQSAEDTKINGTSNFVPYQLPKGRHPFVLLLDGILDPGNLGAILRTAAFLGVNGIAITKDSSATLTAVALKASAGASEVATLFSVSSTRDFIVRSKENGWLVYAAVPATKRSRANSHVTIDRVETYDPLSLQPTLLVIGSEGEGLEKGTRRLADHEVSIPSPPGGLTNIVDSLNVSVATGVLCAGFLKRQSSGMMEIDELPSKSTDDAEAQLW